MPGYPSAPSTATISDKLASIAPELGNIAGLYVYLKEPFSATIYESATPTDSGGNWSIANVPLGVTYQYAYGIHPSTAYPFRGTYVASNPPSTWQPKTMFVRGGSFYREYTVVGDGATDDSSTIMAAYQDAAGNNGALYLPACTMGIGTGMTWANTVPVYGAGGISGRTILKATAAIDLLTLGDGSIESWLQGFRLEGNNLANRGLYLPSRGGMRCTYVDLDIANVKGTPGNGIEGTNTNFSMIFRRCRTSFCNVGAKLVASFQNTHFFEHMAYHNVSGCLQLGGSSNVVNVGLHGCELESETDGVQDVLQVQRILGLTIDDQYMETGQAGSVAVHIIGSGPSVVAIRGIYSNGNGVGVNPIVIDANNTVLSLEGHYFTGHTGTVPVQDNSTGSVVTIQPGSWAGTATAAQPAPAYAGIYADGSDGNVTLDGTLVPAWTTKVGNVYTVVREAFLKNLTVNSGITLNTAGWRIFVQGTLVNRGIVQQNGNDAAGATGGVAFSQSSVAQFASSTTAGTAGATGGTGVGPAGTNQPGTGAGGAGGAGGASGGTGGGAGGTVSQSSTAWNQFRALPSALTGMWSGAATTPIKGGAGGGAGGGDGVNAGGGGGGGAGGMCIAARILDNAGSTIQANGGAGANGVAGNAGGGGGGGGGFMVLIYSTLVALGTVQANGGALGNGVGTGSNGVAGSAGHVSQLVV